MDVQFYFNNISQYKKIYNVQGILIWDPLFFYSQKNLSILSFIIQDVDKNKIECVAFGDEAERFRDQLKVGVIYQINFANTVENKKYVKTSHKFKLHLSIDSEICLLKNQKYLKRDKICVKYMKKKDKKKSNQEKNHQLSILNWLK